jgi:hypothetical protein
MSKPNGYIIYEGPSQLAGQADVPIVAILPLDSANPKTGPMHQLWILRSDMPPHRRHLLRRRWRHLRRLCPARHARRPRSRVLCQRRFRPVRRLPHLQARPLPHVGHGLG